MDDKDKDQSVEVSPTQERISDEDKHVLEMSKMNRKLALAQAEKALAENNAAEQAFKYLVLQLYMKYSLASTDGIDENGLIHRNAAAKESQ